MLSSSCWDLLFSNIDLKPFFPSFSSSRCLVHYLRDKTVRYSKIRPYNPFCQMDLCRHEVRYGCQREDSCFYAHSLIELKVWMMKSEQGEPSTRPSWVIWTDEGWYIYWCCGLFQLSHMKVLFRSRRDIGIWTLLFIHRWASISIWTDRIYITWFKGRVQPRMSILLFIHP